MTRLKGTVLLGGAGTRPYPMTHAAKLAVYNKADGLLPLTTQSASK